VAPTTALPVDGAGDDHLLPSPDADSARRAGLEAGRVGPDLAPAPARAHPLHDGGALDAPDPAAHDDVRGGGRRADAVEAAPLAAGRVEPLGIVLEPPLPPVRYPLTARNGPRPRWPCRRTRPAPPTCLAAGPTRRPPRRTPPPSSARSCACHGHPPRRPYRHTVRRGAARRVLGPVALVRARVAELEQVHKVLRGARGVADGRERRHGGSAPPAASHAAQRAVGGVRDAS
jgi:hypothetical protein